MAGSVRLAVSEVKALVPSTPGVPFVPAAPSVPGMRTGSGVQVEVQQVEGSDIKFCMVANSNRKRHNYVIVTDGRKVNN